MRASNVVASFTLDTEIYRRSFEDTCVDTEVNQEVISMKGYTIHHLQSPPQY